MASCLQFGHALVRIKGLQNYRGEPLYMCWYCKARPLAKGERDRVLANAE